MRRLKSWLIWLTLLALPLQGMAAWSLPGCEHRGAAHSMTMAGNLSGQHAGPPCEHCQGDVGVAAKVHPAAPDAGADAATVQPDSAGDASVQGCCAVSAPMAAATWPALVWGAGWRPPLPEQPRASLYLGVVLDGPERPPRALLA
jgi:hypothetical protein